MAYNVGDITTKVQQRVRDTAFSTTEITGYINDAQNDAFNEYRLPFTQTSQTYTLTVDVPDITNEAGLPSNFVQAIDLSLTTIGYETTLTYIDYDQIERLFPDPTDTTAHPANVPQYWYKFGETINVFPVPNSAYTVKLSYHKRPTLLDSNDDVPEIPSEFEELLVAGAAYRVLQVKDNYDQATVLQNKYDEILQKMVVRYSQQQVGTATRMKINKFRTPKYYF